MNKSAEAKPNREARDILGPKQLEELQEIIDYLRRGIALGAKTVG